jgi:hypothetical protein
MFRFFDFLYFKLYKAYSSSDRRPEGSAMAIISLLQGLNIITGIFLYKLFIQREFTMNKYYGGGVILILVVFNYIRYISKDYFQILLKKFDSSELKMMHLFGAM